MKVKTINGLEVDSKLCRKIQDNYYIVGDPKIEDSGDCYSINGRYVKADSPSIYYDYALQTYRRKSELVNPVDHVIVFAANNKTNPELFKDLDKEERDSAIAFKIRLAEFDPDKMVLISIPLDNEIAESKDLKFIHHKETRAKLLYCLDESIPEKLKFGRNPDYDYFDQKSQVVKAVYKNAKKGKYEKYSNAFDLNLYNAADNLKFDVAVKNHELIKSKISIRPAIKELAKLIDGYKFGCEIESSGGYLPMNVLNKYGVIPVKDGSIEGHEFVTVPYSGAPGLQCLTDVFINSANHLITDEFCSLHYHISGMSNDPDNVVALYMLSAKIQQEVFELFPPYKKDSRFLAQKRNNLDHCKLLPELGLFSLSLNLDTDKDQLNKAYLDICSWFNDGADVKMAPNGKVMKHVREGANKWDYRARYHWINFIPWIFKNQQTVEFRAHNGTVNPIKAINWLLICIAILKFVFINKQAILARKKFNLQDIIEVYRAQSPFIFEYLYEYISHRKDTHYKLKKKDDMYGNEFSTDNTYHFKLKDGKSVLNYL